MSTSKSPNDTKQPFVVRYFDPAIRAKDREGRDLDDVLNFNDNQVERYHDFIQYLFPLPEFSRFNAWAPLVTRQDYEAFRDREELRAELRNALQRMLNFYGFTFAEPESDSESDDTAIILLPNFKQISKNSWRIPFNHNHMRITRIIRCLRVLSCEEEAQAFYQALVENKGGFVGEKSKVFWGRAAKRPLWLSPDQPDEAEGIDWLREVCESKGEDEDGAATPSQKGRRLS